MRTPEASLGSRYSEMHSAGFCPSTRSWFGRRRRKLPVNLLHAATRDELYNALVCTRLAPELGRDWGYRLADSAEHLLHEETGVSQGGKSLGNGCLCLEALAERHAAGWRFALAQAEGRQVSGAASILDIRSGAAPFRCSIEW
jgi:hypothetical protein